MSISANGPRPDITNTQLHSATDMAQTNPDTKKTVTQDAQATIGTDQSRQVADGATIEKKVKQVNKVLDDLNQKFEFRLVEEKGSDVLQLYDKDNKKVIYQNPPEGILEVADKLQHAVGLVIDLKR